ICNVLDKLPKKEQPAAKQLLRSMSYAESRAECERLISRYRKSYHKATDTLVNGWHRMLTLYSFPKQHWVNLRTTNIVAAPLDMIRVRLNAARRFKRVENATSIIWKLLMIGEKAWRSLKGAEPLRDVFEGKTFVDGMGLKRAAQGKEKICA